MISSRDCPCIEATGGGRATSTSTCHARELASVACRCPLSPFNPATRTGINNFLALFLAQMLNEEAGKYLLPEGAEASVGFIKRRRPVNDPLVASQRRRVRGRGREDHHKARDPLCYHMQERLVPSCQGVFVGAYPSSLFPVRPAILQAFSKKRKTDKRES